MRRTFGLTALLLLTLSVLAAAGCTGAADSGAGVLNPFALSSPGGGGTSSPSPSPTFSPLPVGTVNALTSLNNPTRQTVNTSCGDLWLVAGYNLGQSNGRLIRYRYDTQNGVSPTDPKTPQVFTMVDTNGNAVQLTNPVWVDSGNLADGTFFLVVTDGFGVFPGRVLYIVPQVSAPCNYTGTATVTDIATLTGVSITNPLGVDFDGTWLWWTEYNSGGVVRRIQIGATGPTGAVQDFMTGLQYPAGIESNGTYVAFAENNNNRYVLSKFSDPQITLPTQVGAPQTIAITPPVGAPLLIRPFDVKWTGADTFVALDGFAMGVAGGPVPAGAGNGNLRFYTGPGGAQNPSNLFIDLVKAGLTDPVGLGVIYDAAADGAKNRVDVAFTESIVTTGTVRRVGFSTVTPFTMASDQTLLNNFNRGFHALAYTVVSTTAAPVAAPLSFTIWATQGFDMGQANGSVVRTSNNY